MKKIILGKTGIEVTELCFGALPFGPIQKNLKAEEAADILSYALDLGVNFLDTAQLYKTYEPIRIALSNRTIKPVISTKAKAETYEDMEFAIKEALREMDLEYIDIFQIHAAKYGADVFDKTKGALECLQDYKRMGIIKAIGVSTHNVKLVEVAALKEEIDIVFPIINKVGRGIVGGSVEDMKRAISLCEQKGKGIFLMKILGGGTLIDDYHSCLEFGRNLSDNYAIAIGMVSKEEVLYNVKYFNDEKNLEGIINIINKKKVKVTQINCISCGECIEVCHSNAIKFNDAGKAQIDENICIQCGYCIPSCKNFSIRIV